jgi:hypothetical protein
MMQREKVVITMISAYAGIVITELLSPMIEKFFLGDAAVGSIFIKANVSPFTIQTAIFIGVIVLITTRGGMIGRARGLLLPVEVMGYSVLNSALILSTILFFLPEDARNQLSADGKLTRLIIEHHTWWLILPVLALIVAGFRKNSELERM